MKQKIKRLEVKNLIFETAARLIGRKGPRGWTTAELARDCALAKSTLYKIIGSREQLIESVALEQIRVTNDFATSIVREVREYRDAVTRLVEEGPGVLAGRPRVSLAEVFLEYPALRGRILAYQEKARSEIIGFIEKGQKEGYLRDDVEPSFLYDLVRGIIEHYTRSGLEGEALAEAVRKACTCLRDGVLLRGA